MCPIDHYLDPLNLAKSKFSHRERSFLRNRRTPTKALFESRQVIHFCESSAGTESDTFNGLDHRRGCVQRGGEEVLDPGIVMRALPSFSELRAALGGVQSRVVHLSNVELAFGKFESAAEDTEWHDAAQSLLSSWCCTDDPRFKRVGGTVPYLLPPLDGSSWRGTPRLTWAVQALAHIFNDTEMTYSK